MHPMTCILLWVRCLFDRLSIWFWGKWTLKWKFSKMSFRVPRRDTELRFVTKLGKNRPLRSCLKVLWITTQKMGSADSSQPPKWADRAQNSLNVVTPWHVRFGCALPALFQKYWFFGPKSNYNIGFQPTIMNISQEDAILIKNLYLSRAWTLFSEFPDKGWKLESIDSLLKRIRTMGLPFNQACSCRPRSTRSGKGFVLRKEDKPKRNRSAREIAHESGIFHSSLHKIIHSALDVVLSCCLKPIASPFSLSDKQPYYHLQYILLLFLYKPYNK